jgi:hypothetical protein
VIEIFDITAKALHEIIDPVAGVPLYLLDEQPEHEFFGVYSLGLFKGAKERLNILVCGFIVHEEKVSGRQHSCQAEISGSVTNPMETAVIRLLP